MAKQNLKKLRIYNTMELEILEIFEKTKIVNNKPITVLKFKTNGDRKEEEEMFDENEFKENFIRSFCNTVYKYQGSEIDKDYNIYDSKKM